MPRKSLGFTLIELLVVIAITAILGTAGFANYSAFSSSQILNDGVSKVQSLLRIAQTNATSGQTYTTSGQTYNCQSWQVRFHTDKRTVSLLCDDVVVSEKTIALAPNMTINLTLISISPSTTCSSNIATVVYGIIYGQVSFIMKDASGSECSAAKESFKVEIKYSKDTTIISKTITVTKGGQIDEE